MFFWTMGFLKRLSTLIKQQVDDLAAKPTQIHYHRLAMEDRWLPSPPGQLQNSPNSTIMRLGKESIPVTAIPAGTPEGAHKLEVPINNKFAEQLLMTGTFPGPHPPKTGVSRGWWTHPGTGKDDG